MTALEAKISHETAIATGLFEMIPFFERSYDWSVETNAKMQGIEPPPVFSFQSLKAISRSRAESIISASMWPNRWGLTPPPVKWLKEYCLWARPETIVWN